MSDLPNWVYDVVMALQKWSDEHPQLHAEYWTPQGHKMLRVEGACGCEALTPVPDEVKNQARVLAGYLWRPEVDKTEATPNSDPAGGSGGPTP